MTIPELFPGYFRPTEAEFKRIWDEGIVSLDANILLHVYRYSPPLREALFALMEKLGNRLWVSHRVAYEFSKNRLRVIASQEKAYDEVCGVLDRIAETLKSQLPPRHPVIDIEEIKGTFLSLISQKKEALKRQQERHPKVPDEDPAVTRLSALLEGKIGNADTPEREQKIPDEGEKRYKAKLPPGFRDSSKDDDPLHKFGDLIVWRQLLDQVKTAKAPFFIFATDDSSDDWWWKQEGKTIGPHPALLHEAQREASCRAYLYRGDQFIRYGSQHFGLNTDQKLIEEAATVRRVLRLRVAGTRLIPRFRIVETLAAFERLEDVRELNSLASRIWKLQREDNEFLDEELKMVYGLPPLRVILEQTNHLDIRRRGRLRYEALRTRQRPLTENTDQPTSQPPPATEGG